jgi:phycocyanin alpha chain
LSAQAQSLSEGAANQVCQQFPRYQENWHLKAKCTRDIEYFLRGITYCLIVGSTKPLEDYFLSGLKEIYRSLELSSVCAIEALTYLKTNHGLTGDEGIETSAYLDYLINAFPQFSEPPSISQHSQELGQSQDSDDDSLIRGLVVVPHKPKILFETSLQFQVDQLPRLRPQIIIDEPMTEIQND